MRPQSKGEHKRNNTDFDRRADARRLRITGNNVRNHGGASTSRFGYAMHYSRSHDDLKLLDAAPLVLLVLHAATTK